MALFDRSNDRGYRGGMGDEHLRRDYENRSTMDAGGDYRGMNRDLGNRGREREGLWANSWSDGAWTADAADRTERDWHLGSGRGGYDRDIRPAGWQGGGMQRGTGMQGGMSGGGMGMNRGGMDRDRGWNLEGGDWGHNWGSGNLGSGYGAGGMDRDRGDYDRGGMNRGGGFLDRAQNAIRRGWDQVEDRFDRDDDRTMHMGGGSMRGGTSWAGNYDREYGTRGDSGVRGYRDDEGHYGVTGARNDMNRGYGGMSGGMQGGMNRYGSDYDRGGMERGGWQGRSETDTGDPYGDRQNRTPIRMVNGQNRGRYDNQYRGGRNWF
jgi:hypothetical protein